MIRIKLTIKLQKILNNYKTLDLKIIKNIKNQVVFFNRYFVKLSRRNIKSIPLIQKKAWILNIPSVELNNLFQLKL